MKKRPENSMENDALIQSVWRAKETRCVECALTVFFCKTNVGFKDGPRKLGKEREEAARSGNEMREGRRHLRILRADSLDNIFFSRFAITRNRRCFNRFLALTQLSFRWRSLSAFQTRPKTACTSGHQGYHSDKEATLVWRDSNTSCHLCTSSLSDSRWQRNTVLTLHVSSDKNPGGIVRRIWMLTFWGHLYR